jgi:transposase-like protein
VKKHLLKSVVSSPKCKLCGSTKVVKLGSYRGIQRRWCCNCRHKFADNQALAGMKTPSGQVAQALELYFQGVRLTHIPELLSDKFGIFVSYVSIFYWVEHFCQAVTREYSRIRPIVGPLWILDEGPIGPPSSSRRLWVRDIIDIKTHYLLASDTVYESAPDNLAEFIQTATNRANQPPQKLLLVGNGLTPEQQDSVFELFKYWRRVTTTRARIIQRPRKPQKIQTILNGWATQYNFLNRQDILSGQTPAAAAWMNHGMSDWSQLIKTLNLTPASAHRFNHNSNSS